MSLAEFIRLKWFDVIGVLLEERLFNIGSPPCKLPLPLRYYYCFYIFLLLIKTLLNGYGRVKFAEHQTADLTSLYIYVKYVMYIATDAIFNSLL